MPKTHVIVGPDGKPLDPALATRLSQNPNLMVGRVRGPGEGERPRMEIDVAVNAESVKKVEETIKGLQDAAAAMEKMFDGLLERAAELKTKLEALRDAVHT